MTNTELAIKAKAGDKGALATLWASVAWLCFVHARRYFPLCKRAGIEEQDLKQECFFGFLRALDAFDPTGGRGFYPYLKFNIWNACAEALGIRNGRDMPKRPVSLQSPLGESEDAGSLQDLLPDQDAGQPFEDAEERVYTGQLHKALDDLLQEIPERRAAAVRARYFDGAAQRETAAAMCVSLSRVGQLEHQGLRDLKQAAARTHALDQYREFVISGCACRGTGFKAWERGGSVEERITERLYDRGAL